MMRSLRHAFVQLGRLGRSALPGPLARSIARALSARRLRAQAFNDLRSLDEYMLRDIGLSHRAAAEWRVH